MHTSTSLGRIFLACIAGFGLGAMFNASAVDANSEFELASNDYYDDPQPQKRTGPTRDEVRGHENDIQVTRRRATPIPQLTNPKPKRRIKQGRPGYNSSYYGSGGYGGGHGYHYIGHVHHSHCGHHYYGGYGDHYDSRTLGRSCMYGPKGKVIYKPADVICAPEDGEEPAAEPAARPAPAPAVQPTAAPSQPQTQARPKSRSKSAPAARRSAVRSAR